MSCTTTENNEPPNSLKTLPLDRLMNGPLVAWVYYLEFFVVDQYSYLTLLCYLLGSNIS